MTQFIELTNDAVVNIDKIIGYTKKDDNSTIIFVDQNELIEYYNTPLSCDEVKAKIAEARKNDPLERIAAALEFIASEYRDGIHVKDGGK